MNRTIEIIVAPDGSTRVETNGFVGSECRAASRFVEQALGQQAQETLKPEFHLSASAQNQVRQSE